MSLNLAMAFEDRSSPNAASSPSSSCRGISPNSPESTRTSPYTCTTISHEEGSRGSLHYGAPKGEQQQERSFFRITSFALSSPKSECDRQSPMSYRSPSPAESVSSSRSSVQNEPTIQTLKYSITNILKPEFGKSAVLKTKSVPKIGFKPYEKRSEEPKEGKSFSIAPLGSLCQAVSQMGNALTRTPEPVPRSKSPAKGLSNPEEVKKDGEGNVPQLWPAWVYCTRYSDRPSSGNKSFWSFYHDSVYSLLFIPLYNKMTINVIKLFQNIFKDVNFLFLFSKIHTQYISK